jgi:ring-1,2-phenylacetyl-CoA epoxidase subunit PaaC
MAEQPNGDFAQTILRQFLISAFHYYLYEELRKSKDSTIAALAEKSLKEVAYHLRHSAEWVIRLGDGTEESRRRMLHAMDELWMFTDDLFEEGEVEKSLAAEGIAANLQSIKPKWENKIRDVFEKAGLPVPEKVFMITGGLQGNHTEHLGHIRAEMQTLQRMYPGANW